MLRSTFVLLLALAACGGGAKQQATADSPAALPPSPVVAPTATVAAPPPIEGTYALDKDATVSQMEAEIEKMPDKDKREMAKLGVGIVRMMDITLDVQAGGAAKLSVTMPDLVNKGAPPKTKDEVGTWRKDGEEIVITSKGKDVRCTHEPRRLSCAEPHGADQTKLVFVKP